MVSHSQPRLTKIAAQKLCPARPWPAVSQPRCISNRSVVEINVPSLPRNRTRSHPQGRVPSATGPDGEGGFMVGLTSLPHYAAQLTEERSSR